MGFFGPPNVEKLEARKNIKGLIKALTYQKDKAIRAAAAEVLGKIGDTRAVDPLIAALRDKDYVVRKAVAEVLGEIIDVRAVKPLIARLSDEVHDVRKVAAEALVKIGAPAVEPLIASLKRTVRSLYAAKREETLLIKYAVEALGEIGDARAVDPLIAQLKYDEDYVVRKGAAESLIKIGAPVVEPLIACLRDKSWRIREAAIEALGEIGDERAVEPLIEALRDEEWFLRESAAESLEKLGWQPDDGLDGAAYWIARKEWDRCEQMGALVVEPLIEALRVIRGVTNSKRGTLKTEDISIEFRIAVAEVLGKIGSPAVEFLITALRDKELYVCLAAAEALGEIGDERAVEPLIAYLREETFVPTCVVVALTKIGAPAVEPLIAALRDEKGRVRKDVVEALGEIGDARAVESLVAVLRDNDEDVRQVALKRWYAVRREAVFEALGKIGDAGAVEPLVNILKDQDEDKDVRRSAALTLIELYTSGKLDDFQKQSILAMHETIEGTSRSHDDRHNDQACLHSDHSDTPVIKVEFPL